MIPSAHFLQTFLVLCCWSLYVLTTDNSCVKKVEIQPVDLFLFYGEMVSLKCMIYLNPHYEHKSSSGDLQIKVDDHPISVSNVTTDGDAISYSINGIVNNTELMFFSVSCHYRNLQCDRMAHVLMEVDYRPLPVKHGSCVVYNWETMTCTWDLGVHYQSKASEVDICLEYYSRSFNTTEKGKLHLVHCHDNRGRTVFNIISNCLNRSMQGRTINCTFTKGDVFTQGNKYNFTVNVKNTKRNVSELSHWIFDTVYLVKPAKVLNLTAFANKTGLTIKWVHPQVYCSKRFKIQYRPEGSAKWQENMSDLQRITLHGLNAFQNYTIKVTSIPLVDAQPTGYWSDAQTLVTETPEDVPSAVPIFLPGYYYCISESCSKMKLLWKEIEDAQKNGEIIHYRIKIRNNYESQAEITYLPGNATNANIDVSTNETVIIKLTQATRAGYPDKDDAFIILPPTSKRPNTPNDIVVEAINDTRIVVSWIASLPTTDTLIIDAYTVTICHKLGTSTCQKLTDSFTDGLYVTERNISVSDGVYKDYVFGVSVEGHYRQDGRIISSGIQWSNCTYLKDAVSKTPLKLWLEEEDKKSKTFEWSPYDCQTSVGYVQNYVLYFCIAITENCTDTSHISLNRDISYYKITKLLPGKHLVWIRANFSAGLGPESDRLIFQIYQQNNDGDYPSILWLVIVLILLCLLAVVGGAKYMWSYCRGMDKDLRIDVPTTTITKRDVDRWSTSASMPTTSGSYTSSEQMPLLRISNDDRVQAGRQTNNESINHVDKGETTRKINNESVLYNYVANGKSTSKTNNESVLYNCVEKEKSTSKTNNESVQNPSNHVTKGDDTSKTNNELFQISQTHEESKHDIGDDTKTDDSYVPSNNVENNRDSKFYEYNVSECTMSIVEESESTMSKVDESESTRHSGDHPENDCDKSFSRIELKLKPDIGCSRKSSNSSNDVESYIKLGIGSNEENTGILETPKWPERSDLGYVSATVN